MPSRSCLSALCFSSTYIPQIGSFAMQNIKSGMNITTRVYNRKVSFESSDKTLEKYTWSYSRVRIFVPYFSLYNDLQEVQQKNLSKLPNFKIDGLLPTGPLQYSQTSFTAMPLPSFIPWFLTVFFLRLSSLFPVFVSSAPKSRSNVTDLMRPALTSLSYRALTVGVLTLISRDIWLNDFLPFFTSDSSIAMSVSSSLIGMTYGVSSRI